MSKPTLYSALFAFSRQVPNIPKNEKATINGKEYKYASYKDTMEAIDPVLQKNKLFVNHISDEKNVYCIVTHIPTGESIKSFLSIPPCRNAQDLGSVVTYLRRYTLSSVLNLVTEDIDGSTVKSADVTLPTEPATQSIPQTVSEEIPTVSEIAVKARDMYLAAVGPAKEIIISKIRASLRLTEEEKAWVVRE